MELERLNTVTEVSILENGEKTNFMEKVDSKIFLVHIMKDFGIMTFNMVKVLRFSSFQPIRGILYIDIVKLFSIFKCLKKSYFFSRYEGFFEMGKK